MYTPAYQDAHGRTHQLTTVLFFQLNVRAANTQINLLAMRVRVLSSRVATFLPLFFIYSNMFEHFKVFANKMVFQNESSKHHQKNNSFYTDIRKYRELKVQLLTVKLLLIYSIKKILRLFGI